MMVWQISDFVNYIEEIEWKPRVLTAPWARIVCWWELDIKGVEATEGGEQASGLEGVSSRFFKFRLNFVFG